MAYPKKEDNIVGLFFNEPTKHWHFKDIVNQAGISGQRANFWLKKLVADRIIKRIKISGQMPYYIANFNTSAYKNSKKIFALNKMQDTGLLNRLSALKKAKAVVLFGSFARSDWNTESDVDIFVLGDPGELESGSLWEGRTLEVHTCRTQEDIKAIRSGLMNNVVKGFFIKGSVHDLVEVSI